MGEKAEQKKEYILEQAKKIFAQKGFKNVTMKDIVSACNISRGGVYLYFSSTQEIFTALMQLSSKHEQCSAAEIMPIEPSASEEMRNFLNVQMRELQNPSDSLIVATYEFLFAQSATLASLNLDHKFKLAVEQLSAIIRRGVEQGEFSAQPCVAAANIVFLLEGLRISSTVLTFDEDFLNKQMEYVLSMLRGGKYSESENEQPGK